MSLLEVLLEGIPLFLEALITHPKTTLSITAALMGGGYAVYQYHDVTYPSKAEGVYEKVIDSPRTISRSYVKPGVVFDKRVKEDIYVTAAGDCSQIDLQQPKDGLLGYRVSSTVFRDCPPFGLDADDTITYRVQVGKKAEAEMTNLNSNKVGDLSEASQKQLRSKHKGLVMKAYADLKKSE